MNFRLVQSIGPFGAGEEEQKLVGFFLDINCRFEW